MGASLIIRYLRDLFDVNTSGAAPGDVLGTTDGVNWTPQAGGGGGALPTWWTVDSTPGSESVVFGGAVEVNPGRDVSTLVLRGFAGNTEHILQVFDDAGALAVDIDSLGTLDVRKVIIQDPPDTGGPIGSGVADFAPGRLRLTTEDGTVPLEIKSPAPTDDTYVSVQNSGWGSLLEISPIENDDTALLIVSPAVPTVDVMQVWDNAFNNTIFAVTATGGLKATLPTSDPAQTGQLWNDGGTVVLSGSTAGSGAPGGSDTQVQYNNGGAFGGAAGFTFNDATGAVSISPSADDVEALVEVTAPAGFVATSVEASLLTLISEGADRVYVFDAHGDFYINGAVDEGVSQIALNSIDYPGEFVMRSGADGVPFLRAADASDNTIFAVAGTTTIDPTLALGDVFSVDSGGIFYALTSGGVWSAVEIYGDTGEVSNLLGLFRGSDQTIVFSVGPTGYVEMPEQTAPSAPAANNARIFVRDSGGVTQLCARFATGDIMVLGQQGVTTQTYTESNVTTDRTYNANATTIDEISDVLGTLIADLRAKGVVS